MNDQSVFRDERTVFVENASYRISYLVMSFGVLVCVIYRAFFLQQNSWDLLALVLLGGITATGYQIVFKVITRRWIITVLVISVISGLIAFALMVIN